MTPHCWLLTCFALKDMNRTSWMLVIFDFCSTGEPKKLLGNAEWFVNVFSGIRERYPAYQIAIFKITAPADGSVGSVRYNFL